MKKFYVPVLIMLFVLSMMGMSHAVPMYYTFEGNITSINDGIGVIADAGLSVGSKVDYTFIVDYDKPGSYLQNDGTTYNFSDVRRHFYTDYFSGSALYEKNGGLYNSSWDRAELNFGLNFTDQSILYGNSDDDYILISGNSLLSEWVQGYSGLYAYQRVYDSYANMSYLRADMTLTRIAPVSAVPEPTTMMLISSILTGLAGFGFIRKKQ